MRQKTKGFLRLQRCCTKVSTFDVSTRLPTSIKMILSVRLLPPKRVRVEYLIMLNNKRGPRLPCKPTHRRWEKPVVVACRHPRTSLRGLDGGVNNNSSPCCVLLSFFLSFSRIFGKPNGKCQYFKSHMQLDQLFPIIIAGNYHFYPVYKHKRRKDCHYRNNGRNCYYRSRHHYDQRSDHKFQQYKCHLFCKHHWRTHLHYCRNFKHCGWRIYNCSRCKFHRNQCVYQCLVTRW